MIEQDYSYVLTGPEIELIEMIRLAHMGNFSMAVSHRDDRFTIKLTHLKAGLFLEGSGATFENCWRGLAGSDLQGMDLDLQERMAARGVKVPDRLQVVGGTAV